MRASRKVLGITLLALLIVTIIVLVAVWREDRKGMLTVSFLDIGQGDAIFIDSPSGVQVLIDGGPDNSVLQSLGEVMPWYDHSIDLVIATHPDSDHIGGLIDVLKRYDVDMVIESSVHGSTSIWNSFERTIGEGQFRGRKGIQAMRGQVVSLGDSVYLELLAPDRALPGAETNTACIVSRLVYGSTSFMLPCDAPQSIESYLVSLDGSRLKSDVLKAGHHGSRTSSSKLFIGFVDPSFAVFSRGCENKYGHPHEETIATFEKFNIPTSDTCREGTVTFVSDGSRIWKE